MCLKPVLFFIQLIGDFCSEPVCGSEPDPIDPLSQQLTQRTFIKHPLFERQWRERTSIFY